MASVVYNRFKQGVLQGDYDLGSGGDTIAVALVGSSYSVDIDSHEDWADVSAYEVSGTNYTAGGEALANQAVSKDTGDDEGVFDADDVTWSSATVTARYAIVYKDTGTDSTSLLICQVDFTEDKTASGGDFKIAWDSEGIVNVG